MLLFKIYYFMLVYCLCYESIGIGILIRIIVYIGEYILYKLYPRIFFDIQMELKIVHLVYLTWLRHELGGAKGPQQKKHQNGKFLLAICYSRSHR